MNITKDIKYIGVNDHEIDLFEGQYIVPNGMAYNSYAIVDEKIAIMDSVDAHFGQQWLSNIENALEGRKPDYLWFSTWNLTILLTSSPLPMPIRKQKSFLPPKHSR